MRVTQTRTVIQRVSNTRDKEKFEEKVAEAIEDVLEEAEVLYDDLRVEFSMNDHAMSALLIWRQAV